MMIRYERPYSYAAHWARRFARVSFVLFALSLLAHRFGPLTTPHFMALVGLSGVFALLGVLLAVVGLARLWQVAAIGGLASAAALVYAAPALGFIGFGAVQYLTRPAIYDVSTDTVTPPPWLEVPQTEESWLKRKDAVTPRTGKRRSLPIRASPAGAMMARSTAFTRACAPSSNRTALASPRSLASKTPAPISRT